MPKNILARLRAQGYEKLHWSGRDGTFDDLSGNGNNLTPNGTVIKKCENGFSAWFDGVNDYASINDQSYFSPANASMTWAIWVRCGSMLAATARNIVCKRAGGNYEWGLVVNNGDLVSVRFDLYTLAGGAAGTITQVGSFSENARRFRFYVVTYADPVLTLYVDGLFNVTGNRMAAIGDGIAPVQLGAGADFPGSDYLCGFADELYIYSGIALSATEVSQLYGLTHPWGMP